jgi:hypothetical protein
VLLLTACSASPPEVTGPYTGSTVRFVVERLTLPLGASDFGYDLDGDWHIDNRLGAMIAGGTSDLTDAAEDMRDSGVLASIVELISDDPELRNDPTVGVRFLGSDGETADWMGATLSDGVLQSNAVQRTQHPASATVHLPLFEYADPLALPATGLHILVTLADDGSFDGQLNGAFPDGSYQQRAWLGYQQMLAARPSEFLAQVEVFDRDRDGEVSFAEFTGNPLLHTLLAPDVKIAGTAALSFGVGLHLVPCADGNCAPPPAHPCSDRITDGDETDIDCGGSCALRCPGSAHCTVDADCQSQSCQQGSCAAPSCFDNVPDGYESDVDCGWNCIPCVQGEACHVDTDCATGACGVLSTCVTP